MTQAALNPAPIANDPHAWLRGRSRWSPYEIAFWAATILPFFFLPTYLSLASQIAGANKLPFAKADVTIDSVPTGAEIDKALVRLETIARERGSAVGYATALPVTIERAARWAKSLAGRGITLIPVSAIAVKPKSS